MKIIDQANTDAILTILDESAEMSLATCRPDGFPQATTVNFVHDQLILYCAVGLDSQKAHNIRANGKVSATINRTRRAWNELQGLSIGGTASVLAEEAEMRAVADRLLRRHPHLRQFIQGTATVPWSGMLFIKIVPKVISILDYRKRFGHTELVEVP
jgi:nitroimidazol reductase NimA-like FMN-containing flavoprotein (pyridoxamine 5'-phosphate oxidase superfamily)